MEKRLTVLKICTMCQESHFIMLHLDQVERIKAGESIQVVAPELSVDEREILISGICGTCFDKIMGQPEEPEDF